MSKVGWVKAPGTAAREDTGGARRDPPAAVRRNHGGWASREASAGSRRHVRRLDPPLYGGCCQEVGWIRALRLFSSRWEVSLFDRGVSSSPPTFCRSAPRRRGQGWPQATAGGGAQAALMAPSTARGLRVGMDGRGMRAERESLDWAAYEICGNAASPCIRSGAMARYPNLSCMAESKAQQRRDPSTEAG
jgi:hypothetical protein